MQNKPLAEIPVPVAYRYLAEGILRDAIDQGTYFGDRKVFLSTIPGIDLSDPECREMLETLRQTGLLDFARADLVGAMDPALVAASEWVEAGPCGVGRFETHFLVLPDHLARR